MPRGSKAITIGESVEYHGISVEIKYERQTGRFVAEYSGSTYAEERIDALKANLLEVIKASLDLTWSPVIHVRWMNTYAQSSEHFIGIIPTRLYVATGNTATYKQVDWDMGTRGRFLEYCSNFSWDQQKNGPFDPPHTLEKKGNNPEYWIPYTEEAWNVLLGIQNRISRLKADLHVLFSHPSDLLRLSDQEELLLIGKPKEEHS